jgi:RNA polymerase sigma factor (sigma-70 family)
MNIETADYRLWEEFRKGEKQALSHIYFSYIDRLFRYGKKFSSDNELIKDTIQDLFFDLIRSRSKLGSTDHIYFYLVKSFRRRLFSNIEGKRKREIRLGKGDFPEADITYSIEYELISKEELTNKEKLVQKGLSELSPKQREILYYRYTCDFEYEQICELMSIKYDSARKMVFRALQSLKSHLKEPNFLLFMLHVRR